jgi:hypothetical protein
MALFKVKRHDESAWRCMVNERRVEAARLAV